MSFSVVSKKSGQHHIVGPVTDLLEKSHYLTNLSRIWETVEMGPVRYLSSERAFRSEEVSSLN